MAGRGTRLKCDNCGEEWELNEYGEIKSLNNKDIYTHIPDWYRWERSEVKKEIENGQYSLDIDVEIRALKDMKCLYNIGKGHLHHDINGFHLIGCDGKLDFKISSRAQYSLYSDYYWYEIGDMVAVGDNEVTYYCFPIDKNIDIAAKTRIATEEIFRKLTGK